jgi:hypothetical protein
MNDDAERDDDGNDNQHNERHGNVDDSGVV